MLDDDLSAMADASEQDFDELTEYLERFLEKSEKRIAVEELDEVEYRVLSSHPGGGFIPRIASRKPVIDAIQRSADFFEFKEAEELLGYLSEHIEGLEQMNGMIAQNYLLNILRDAFGKHGEKIENWNERIAEITARVEADLVGRPKLRSKSLLSGIRIQEDLRLFDSCWLRTPDNEEIIHEELLNYTSMMKGTPGRHRFAETILEMEVVEDEEAMNEVTSRMKIFYINLFRIYGCANAHITTSIEEGVTYHNISSTTANMTSRDTLPRYSFNAIDVRKFRNLCDLLMDYFKDRKFKQPVGLAISHLDDALDRRTSPQDSISFCIIGLESLYKGQSEGNTTNTDVARFCAIVLDAISDGFDPTEVKTIIEDAYEVRNTWAHGGHSGSKATKSLQESLWNILRASIIAFAWLNDQRDLASRSLNLDAIFIEQKARTELKDDLENLRVYDYLPIRRL